jgi:transposase
VPARLAARARVFDTGQGRKTDAHDAHAVVMVALRDPGLREVVVDADLKVLRLLCERRDALSRAHVQALDRAHRLFAELLPGGAPVRSPPPSTSGCSPPSAPVTRSNAPGGG